MRGPSFVTSTKKHLPPANLQPTSEFDFRRAPRSIHPLRSLKRQSTLQLEKKSELEWTCDFLRSASDDGVLLGGALALSLENSLVL